MFITYGQHHHRGTRLGRRSTCAASFGEELVPGLCAAICRWRKHCLAHGRCVGTGDTATTTARVRLPAPPGTHWHQGRSRRQRPVNIGHGGAGSFPGVVVVVISFGPRCGGVQGELPWYHRAPLCKSFPGAPREHSPRGDHFECYHARERSGHLLHEHY